MKFQQVYAVVDTRYRLLWVGGEWDEFALQNAAQKALANSVLSTSIMSHIVGEETRLVTQRLIDVVLEHKRPLRMDYRCDSPRMARIFQLTIQPMKDDRALMVHDLRDAWHFSPPLRPWSFHPEAEDMKCSFCGDVRFAGQKEWKTCEEIGENHPENVNYEICVSCYGRVRAAIAEVTTPAPTGPDTAEAEPSEPSPPRDRSRD